MIITTDIVKARLSDYANKNNLNYIMFYNEDDVEKFLSVYDK